MIQKEKRLNHLSIVSGICFIVSLLPILWLSFYDYASGDDLHYGAGLRQVFREGGGFGEAVASILSQVRGAYDSWQGTWSSIVLFCLEPSVWGEKVYHIVPWLALLFLLGGTGVLLYELLVRQAGLPKAFFWITFFVIGFGSVQYMPYLRGGIFWYTSVAHYVFPYGVGLCCIAGAIRWIRGQRSSPCILAGLILGMTYLGGAGYPPLALTGAAVFFILLAGCREKQSRKRSMLLLMPLLLEAIGFIISAKAPGNVVRGGSDFGLHGSRILYTLAQSALQSITGTVQFMVGAPLLVLLLLFIVLLTWKAAGLKRYERSFSHPVLMTMVCWILLCATYAPGIYAGVEVSGGVPDTIFFATLLLTATALIWITGALRRRWEEKLKAYSKEKGKAYSKEKEKANAGKPEEAVNEKAVSEKAVSDKKAASDKMAWIEKGAAVLLVAAFALLLVFGRSRLIRNTVDYTCLSFARSGQLADYEAQMQERLALLSDDGVRDVIVPEMNSEQGPFMHMALMQDPESYTNQATARFYGKDSVTAVPREEFGKSVSEN